MNLRLLTLCAITLILGGARAHSAPPAPGRTAHRQAQHQLWVEKAESAQVYIGRVEEVLPEGLVVDCGTEETDSSWFSKFLSGYPRFEDFSPGDRIKFRAFRDGSHYFKAADGTARALMKFTYCEEVPAGPQDSPPPARDTAPAARKEARPPPPAAGHESDDAVVW